MGFFDKIFGKNKRDKNLTDNQAVSVEEKENISNAVKDETSETANEAVTEGTESAAETKTENARASEESAASGKSAVSDKETSENKGEKVTAAVEMFPVKKDSVIPERSAVLCTRFINNALSTGMELKKDDFRGLTYSELCLIYNNMQIMTLKLDPKIKAIAGVVIGNNIKVLRELILASLKKMTLYVLYTKVNRLPFISKGALYVFTDKGLAEAQAKKSDIKYLGVKEITPELIEAHFDVFYVTGYKEIIVDLGTKLPITAIYTPKEDAAYGLINPVACGKMIFFNQMTAAFGDTAKAESRSISDEENKQINRVWADITETLIHSTLLVPAEKAKEEGKIKLKAVSVKSPEGKNWIALFTDQIALNTFFKANQPAAGIKNPVLSQYELIKNNPDIEGLIVNPGRESFRIPSRVLATRKQVKPDEAANGGNQ